MPSLVLKAIARTSSRENICINRPHCAFRYCKVKQNVEDRRPWLTLSSDWTDIIFDLQMGFLPCRPPLPTAAACVTPLNSHRCSNCSSHCFLLNTGKWRFDSLRVIKGVQFVDLPRGKLKRLFIITYNAAVMQISGTVQCCCTGRDSSWLDSYS